MNFLTPWVAAGLAAVVVPLLVLLYFLKLRRREEKITSTLLWKRAVQDLQVNAPFQRLRKNLLLLLQLLVLAAALLALARPVIETSAAQEESLVILIDRSASMNTVERGGDTRLDLAKEQAVRLVRSLNQNIGNWFSFGGGGKKTRVMVVAFSDRATVISPFTTNTTDLVDDIERITPTDAQTNLGEALQLAEAYLAQTTVELTSDMAKQGSKLILLSDGRIRDLGELSLRHGEMELVPIGDAVDNAGIVALRVERDYERPEIVNVFLQIQNFGPEPVESDVALYANGALQAVERETFAAGAMPDLGPPDANAPPQQAGVEAPAGSRKSLTMEFALDEAAVIEAQFVRGDALPVDNRAYATVPPPRKLSVLLVSEGNFFLESVLDGLPLESVRRVSPADYESLPDPEIQTDGQSNYDVVIVEKHSTERLPQGNYLFIAGIPEIEGVEITGVDEQPDLFWDDTHPILRYVELQYVFVAKALAIETPPEAEVIAESPTGPLLTRFIRDGRQYILLHFDVMQSNWVSKPSFPVFFYNLLRYLGSAGAVGGGRPFLPGESLPVPVPPDAEQIALLRPDDAKATLTPGPGAIAYYGGVDRVGLYRVEEGVTDRDTFAVNLSDPAESDITPRTQLRIGAVEVAQGERIETATPEVWRWFVLAALVILLIEWYIYNRRVMI